MAKKDNKVIAAARHIEALEGYYYITGKLIKPYIYDRIKHGADPYEPDSKPPNSLYYHLDHDWQFVRTEYDPGRLEHIMSHHDQILFIKYEKEAEDVLATLRANNRNLVTSLSLRNLTLRGEEECKDIRFVYSLRRVGMESMGQSHNASLVDMETINKAIQEIVEEGDQHSSLEAADIRNRTIRTLADMYPFPISKKFIQTLVAERMKDPVVKYSDLVDNYMKSLVIDHPYSVPKDIDVVFFQDHIRLAVTKLVGDLYAYGHEALAILLDQESSRMSDKVDKLMKILHLLDIRNEGSVSESAREVLKLFTKN